MALRSSKNRSARDDAPRPQHSDAESLIAAGMVIEGDCETAGTLRVDGHVTGNVSANRLTIGPAGHVEGDVGGPNGGPSEREVLIEGRVDGAVRAPRVEIGREGAVGGGMQVGEAVVRGRVAGAIVTEHRLLLEETAVVEGDVIARRLGLKEGGQVFGTIRIGEPPRGRDQEREQERESGDERRASGDDAKGAA